MADWVNRIDLSDITEDIDEDDDQSVIDGAKKIAAAIKQAPFYKTQKGYLQPIIDSFDQEVKDKYSFNMALGELYDWGDIALDGKWDGRKMCWIKTSF